LAERGAAPRIAFDGIDPVRRALLQPGRLALDLSAIAKGFGVDLVARRLDALGITDHLVEVGGELRGSGVKPDGQPWWVALEHPDDGDAGEQTLLALHGLSVATSGDYRRWFEHAGTPGAYLASFNALAQLPDLVVSSIKAVIFGYLAGVVAAYRGLNPKGGPKGVGDVVNQSVVITFLLLFFVNTVLTALYLQLVPAKGT